MAGLLRTYIANVRYAFAFDSATPGPNSGAGASEALGPSAVVVQIDLLWYPPDGPIAWGEGGLTVGRASAWHEDAQNPGWVFRERKTCLGRTCVHIVEWHGPKALDEAVKAGADIAEALRLKPGWIDPTA
jgi:hypothetical protein